MKIYILEDDARRREAMRACLSERFYQYEIRFFVAVAEMIDELRGGLNQTILIALDHDLEPQSRINGDWPDPGDGRMVADYLATQSPVCPVIVHTTNSPAAVGMETVLQDAGWTTHRVKPYSDLEWIAESWFPAVRRAIVDAASPKRQSANQPS